MGHTTIWPRKPELTPEVEAALERHGVDGLRAILSGYPIDATDPQQRILVGKKLQVERGKIEDWMTWKAGIAALWIQAGVMLALIAAVAGIIAAVEGWPALGR